MNSSEVKEYLRTFYHAFRVPVSLVVENEIWISYTPIALKEDLCMKEMQHYLRKDTKVMYMRKEALFYGAIWNEENQMFLLIGPVNSVKGNEGQYDRMKQSFGLSIPQKHLLVYFLEKTPVMDPGRFFAMLRFLNRSVNGGSMDVPMRDVLLEENGISEKEMEDLEKKRDRLVGEAGKLHNTEWLEREILHLIEAGKKDLLVEKLRKIPTMEIDAAELSENEARNLQIIAITGTALCSRAAIRGGLKYEYAMEMSDRYIRQFEKEKNVDQLTIKLGLMMTGFCEKVQQLKRTENMHPLTLKIMSDVQTNLYSRLGISEIAERLSRSSSYLSHTFAADTGKDLRTYIREQKIEEAKRLLEDDEKSILQISELLCFSSQAHFQNVFKKEVGKTPLQYRNEKILQP